MSDTEAPTNSTSVLLAGWAQADITPPWPVLLAGQFHARLSEGVADPVTATACALDGGGDHAVFVSADLVGIPNDLRDAVRRRLAGLPGLDPAKVILHATHTHTGPELRTPSFGHAHASGDLGVDLDVAPVARTAAFVADRVAAAVQAAWTRRAPARLAYGLGHAVIGRNRRWVDAAGSSTMYGDTNTSAFSHIEGYEDHALGVLALRDAGGTLTGLVVNVACPSQVSEHDFRLSADFWHDTRLELRRRLGDGLHVLAQCSAAGDLSPHLLFDRAAEQRMLARSGRSVRQEIARRIADAVEGVLHTLADADDAVAPLQHVVAVLPLPLNALSEGDVQRAQAAAEADRQRYEEELQKLRADPALRHRPRWYVPATAACRHMTWNRGVAERFALQQTNPCWDCEAHVLRLGDVAIAANPFEYYLDYGTLIKARSRATQTFLVQLAGAGTYVPSLRSVAGGGYGSLPASNPVGPEGGRRLADWTIDTIAGLWSATAAASGG